MADSFFNLHLAMWRLPGSPLGFRPSSGGASTLICLCAPGAARSTLLWGHPGMLFDLV